MPEADIKYLMVQCYYRRVFNSHELKDEHIFKKYNFYIRAVAALWTICSNLFLSPWQTCLDFDLPDITPVSLPIVPFQTIS